MPKMETFYVPCILDKEASAGGEIIRSYSPCSDKSVATVRATTLCEEMKKQSKYKTCVPHVKTMTGYASPTGAPYDNVFCNVQRGL